MVGPFEAVHLYCPYHFHLLFELNQKVLTVTCVKWPIHEKIYLVVLFEGYGISSLAKKF
jgi:hypothetical protein